MIHKHSLTALALCGIMGLSAFCTPFTAYAAYERDASGVYRMDDGTAIEKDRKSVV